MKIMFYKLCISLLFTFDYSVMNLKILDVSLNSESSFNHSFASYQREVEESDFNEDDEVHHSENTTLSNISIGSNTSAICCTSPTLKIPLSSKGDIFKNQCIKIAFPAKVNSVNRVLYEFGFQFTFHYSYI